MHTQPDSLILTFAPGGSLSRWERLGRLEREKDLLRGLLGLVPHIVFTSNDGPEDIAIAQWLSEELGGRIEAIPITSDDPELGPGRPLHERILARIGHARRVVIQTMQLDDGGISRRILGPLRRAGVQAALVARGGYIGSRVLASAAGPHSHGAVSAGSGEHDLCRQAQIVVGVSDSMIDELCWRHGINPDRCRVIPHFVSETDERVAAADRDPHMLCTVGELTGPRGVEVLIRAVALMKSHEQTRFEIIGDGPERGGLESLARELGVNATFTGRLPHGRVIERLRACALFLHASSERRQSRSILEAMAMGAPVIVTDIPEVDGVVESGASGLCIKPTPEAFAFAIENTLGDADWREMLGSCAAKFVRSRCSLKTILELCGSAYADALRIAPVTVQPRSRRAG